MHLCSLPSLCKARADLSCCVSLTHLSPILAKPNCERDPSWPVSAAIAASNSLCASALIPFSLHHRPSS